MRKVLERTKEITRWEIAVSSRLSPDVNDGNYVLTCDREGVLQRADGIL